MSSARSRSGGHAQRDDVEAVEEVLAERARRDHRLEVAVGRADDADVDLARALAADRAHLAVLQDAQELGLHAERHLADLVEEERAAVGHVEETRARRRGPGEGAAHVAEERGLEQRLGDARAVLADEGAPAARPVGVDGAGDELLAGAALADDEHRDVARRHAVDQAEQLAHRLAPADDVVVGVARLVAVARRAASCVRVTSSSASRSLEDGLDAGARTLGAAQRRAAAGPRRARRRSPSPPATRRRAPTRAPRGPKAPAPHAVVEVDDAERLSPRDERHGEDAAQPEGVDAGVHVARAWRRRRSRRPRRPSRGRGARWSARAPAARPTRSWRARLRAARGTRRPSGARSRSRPALDAGPEDHRVEHLLEQRTQPVARRERAHDRLELRDLRRARTSRPPRRAREARAHATAASDGPVLGGRAFSQGRARPPRASSSRRAASPSPRLGREAQRRVEGRPARAQRSRDVEEREQRRRGRRVVGDASAPGQRRRGPRAPPLPPRRRAERRCLASPRGDARFVDGVRAPRRAAAPPIAARSSGLAPRRPSSASMAHVARPARRPERAPRPAPIARRPRPARPAIRAPARAPPPPPRRRRASRRWSRGSRRARARPERLAAAAEPLPEQGGSRRRCRGRAPISPASAAAAASLVRYVASSTTAPARVASSTARPKARAAPVDAPRASSSRPATPSRRAYGVGVERMREAPADGAQRAS